MGGFRILEFKDYSFVGADDAVVHPYSQEETDYCSHNYADDYGRQYLLVKSSMDAFSDEIPDPEGEDAEIDADPSELILLALFDFGDERLCGFAGNGLT